MAHHGEVVGDEEVGRDRARPGAVRAGSRPAPGSTRRAQRPARPARSASGSARAHGRHRCADAARRRTRGGSGWRARGSVRPCEEFLHAAPTLVPPRGRGSATARRRSRAPSSRVQRRVRILEDDLDVAADGTHRRRLSVVISRPSKTILPAVGSSSLMIVRPSVVLPQPDSPTMPTVSPGRTVKSTPSTALT